MPIFVETQSGNTVIALDVEPDDTIESVKRKITDEVGIPVDQQGLTFEDGVYAGMTLKDEHTLKDYNIQGKATLYLNPIPRMKRDSGGFSGASIFRKDFTSPAAGGILSTTRSWLSLKQTVFRFRND